MAISQLDRNVTRDSELVNASLTITSLGENKDVVDNYQPEQGPASMLGAGLLTAPHRPPQVS
jgi:hypothetical protein